MGDEYPKRTTDLCRALVYRGGRGDLFVGLLYTMEASVPFTSLRAALQRTNTLITFSISPPRKFTKALFSLQTSLKGLKESFAMIQDTKIEQNHIVFQVFFSKKRDLLEKTLKP